MFSKDLGLSQDLIDAVRAITEASCSAKKMEKEELHPNQVKLDKNKNGKLDAHDFKLLRAKKGAVEEEVQELEEGGMRAGSSAIINNKEHPLHNQRVKVLSGAVGRSDDPTHHVRTMDGKDHTVKAKHLVKSPVSFGYPKLAKEEVEEVYLEDYTLEEIQDFMMSEDFEQLDELSKNTLGSYVKKAANDMGNRGAALAHKQASAAEVDRMTNRNDIKNKFDAQDKMKAALGADSKSQQKDYDKIGKRQSGISKAVTKLTKEQVEDFMQTEAYEQLDELSKKTLGSYVNKAANDVSDKSSDATDAWNKREHKRGFAAGKKVDKRLVGISKATGKLTKEQVEDFMQTEAYEQLDELSKKTLGSYVKKATDDYTDRETRISRALDNSSKKFLDPNINKAAVKQTNRKLGMNKAIDKLTKEQVEEIEMLAAKHGLGE